MMACLYRLLVLCTVCVLFLLSGCNKRPDDVLSEEQMVDILTDIELAQAYNRTTPAGATYIDRKVLVNSVLDKYGVSQAQMDSTIAYYGRNMDEYYLLYDKVERNLRSKNPTASIEQINQSDDFWPYHRFTVFLPNQLGNELVFSIPADKLERGNTIEWLLHLSASGNGNIMLGVEYDNGVSSFIKKPTGVNVSQQISLQTDTGLNVKRIFGSLSVEDRAMPFWADSIRLVKLPYDSLNYSRIRTQKYVFPPRPRSAEDVEGSVVADTVAPDLTFKRLVE